MTAAANRGPWPELRIDIGRLGQREDLVKLKLRSASDAKHDISVQVESKGLEITTSRIPDGSLITVVGAMDSAMAGIEFDGSVSASFEGECRRCIEVVTQPLQIDLLVSFVPDLAEDDDSDAYPIINDRVDLGEAVREELMLALPLSPLCADGCGGADPERYPAAVEVDQNNADGDAGDADPAIDPRWAGLSELTFDED